jgi:pyrroloquinoline-quinone synthase
MSLLLQDPVIQMFNSTAKQPCFAWDDFSDCATLDAAVAKVAAQYEFSFHPYFLWMNSSQVNRGQFLQSQLPLRYVVEALSQSLAAVLARTATLESRLGLMNNLQAEHGDGNPLRSSKATFRQYLQSLGATAESLESSIAVPVLAFNQSVLNYCLTQSPEAGAAMLGMIKHLSFGIGDQINKTIHDRDWVVVADQSLSGQSLSGQSWGEPSYDVHPEALDNNCASDLFRLAQFGWDQPRSRAQLTQALTLGAHYYWDLYVALYPDA